MKKQFILLSMAVAALASCSNDESVSQVAQASGDALIIRPAMQGTTRVASYDNQNFDKFHLFATGQFNDKIDADGKPSGNAVQTISEDLSTPEWKLATTLYWADKTTEAHFTAYAPATLSVDEQNVQTIDTDRAKQKDIVVAYNKGVKNDFRSGVPLHFRHVLSQVMFQAYNKDADSLQVKVRGMRLVNINSEAKLALPTIPTTASFDWANYTPWISTSITPKEYSVTVAAEKETEQVVLTNSEAKDITFGDSWLLLPQQLQKADLTTDGDGVKYAKTLNDSYSGTDNYVSFLIQVQRLQKDEDGSWKWKALYPELGTSVTDLSTQGWAWAALPLDTNWEPGKKYIYTINFSKYGIGEVDPDQGDGGTTITDPDPGEDIIPDTPLELFFTVDVIDWNEVQDTQNL